jgi:hypothetical protein
MAGVRMDEKDPQTVNTSPIYLHQHEYVLSFTQPDIKNIIVFCDVMMISMVDHHQ